MNKDPKKKPLKPSKPKGKKTPESPKPNEDAEKLAIDERQASIDFLFGKF